MTIESSVQLVQIDTFLLSSTTIATWPSLLCKMQHHPFTKYLAKKLQLLRLYLAHTWTLFRILGTFVMKKTGQNFTFITESIQNKNKKIQKTTLFNIPSSFSYKFKLFLNDKKQDIQKPGIFLPHKYFQLK